MGGPEENVKLEPGEIKREETNERKYKLGHHGPRDFVQVSGQKVGVEVGAVANREPHVEEEEAKVSVVSVSHAIAHKHAMMLSFQDTDPTTRAMPGSWGLNGLAAGAKFPLLLDHRGQDDVPGGGVGQPKANEVSNQVDEQEGADGGVKIAQSIGSRVQFVKHDRDLVEKRKRYHYRDKYKGTDIGYLPGKKIFSSRPKYHLSLRSHMYFERY